MSKERKHIPLRRGSAGVPIAPRRGSHVQRNPVNAYPAAKGEQPEQPRGVTTIVPMGRNGWIVPVARHDPRGSHHDHDKTAIRVPIEKQHPADMDGSRVIGDGFGTAGGAGLAPGAGLSYGSSVLCRRKAVVLQ